MWWYTVIIWPGWWLVVFVAGCGWRLCVCCRVWLTIGCVCVAGCRAPIQQRGVQEGQRWHHQESRWAVWGRGRFWLSSVAVVLNISPLDCWSRSRPVLNLKSFHVGLYYYYGLWRVFLCHAWHKRVFVIYYFWGLIYIFILMVVSSWHYCHGWLAGCKICRKKNF